MKKISATIITFNEEKNIERCLKSLQDVADEIVVVDSYSTDKTEEICSKYHVKFFKNPFEGHIEQKNYAITLATYPHILSLDADEALSPKLKESILKVKNNWSADGYYFNRMTNYCGKWIKHSGWYPDRKLRLWDSRKGKWGGVNPHDKFLMEKGSEEQHINGDLLHYSYGSYSEHVIQIDKFSTIQANEMFKKKKSISILIIIIKPFFKFIRHYFLKLGFLDGFAGFIISINSAYGQFLRYIKLKHLYKNAK